jgi:uncharacterized protein with HEPN domain
VVRNLEVIGEASNNIVWQTIQHDLPSLREQIAKLLEP